MAIAHVNDIYRQDTTSASISGTITGTTLGNGLIIYVCWQGGSAVTISAEAMSGETVTAFTNGGAATTDRTVKTYYVKNLASGGSKTFTATLSGSQYWSVAIMEISGQNATTFDDGSAVTNTTPSANTSLAVVTTVDNCFCFAALSSQDGNRAKGAESTATTATWAAYSFYDIGEYKLAGAAGSTALTFINTATTQADVAVAVRPAGGAPTPPVPDQFDAVTIAEVIAPNLINMPKVFN